MGLVLQQTAGAGAPNVEDAIYDARFDGVTPESHPDWAGPNKFGGQDDGERWRFAFTLLDDSGAELHDDGKAIEVDVLTNQSMHKKSNGYAIMAGILSKGERDVIDGGGALDSDAVVGRRVQVVIEHNASGWPKVASVMPARKGAAQATPKTATKPAAVVTEAVDDDDEEAALAVQLEAARAKKAAAAAAGQTTGVGPTKADQAAAAAKAERIAAAKAALAALEAEEG